MKTQSAGSSEVAWRRGIFSAAGGWGRLTKIGDQEGVLEGLVLVQPTHPPTLVWEGRAGPRPRGWGH